MRHISFVGIVVALMLIVFALPVHAKDVKITPPEKELFMDNPKYNPEGLPAKDKKLRLKKSKKAVAQKIRELKQEITQKCSQNEAVFIINKEKSSLHVTAFKNWKVPVKSKFNNFFGYVSWNPKAPEPKGTLLIDSGSLSSGVIERDNRVMRFLFKAQKKKSAYAMLDMEYIGNAPLQPGYKKMEGELDFRGKDYEIKTKSRVRKEGSNWLIQSVKPFRLVADFPKKDMMGIMKLCNHQNIAPSGDLEWQFVLEPACK